MEREFEQILITDGVKTKRNFFVANKGFTATFVYFISALLFLILKICSSFNLFNFMGDSANIIVNAFVQVGIMFLIPLGLYLALTKQKPAKAFNTFQFKYIGWRTILTSFLLGIFVYFAVILISTFCASFWHMLGYRNPTSSGAGSPVDTSVWTGLLLPILTTAILPAFCEEFSNRGLLLNGLTDFYSARKAILISAICFGLLHYNINQCIYAIFVGLVAGSLTYFTRSIFPAMIVHFTNNFLATYLSWASATNSFGAAFDSLINSVFSGNIFIVFVKVVLVITLVALGIVVLINEIYAQTRKNRLYDKLSTIAVDYLGEGTPKAGGIIFESGEKETAKQQAYSGEVFVKMKEEVIKEMTEDNEEKTFLERIVPKDKTKKRTKPWQNVFVASTIFMTGILTIFTLIWGFL